ncbi:coiled-coil domain-containing protein [Helicobacter pylori]|uniref:coiled-coil domain-containing protein n=1 Tax=Helicobacter pylori TaxID=210 RepID=UPI0036F20259
MFGKSSNDTQENPKDAQKSTSFQEKYTKPTETTELVEKNQKLTTEKENLNNQLNASQKQVNELKNSQQVLENEKAELTNENTKLKNEKTELADKNKVLTTEKTELNNKITRLTTEKDNLTKDKENLTTELSAAKSQANQTSQKLNELERRHAPYQKLEKLYEVFLEVKDRLNFGFAEKTHSAMDLIASVLSDSKYYLESLYNKASQELSDKRSDKGEKLAELFDLLFEYIKDSKFERLKEPSAYDYSCKTLYPEQNTSQKMQRVVLRGYTYDKKIACYTIVDMGS